MTNTMDHATMYFSGRKGDGANLIGITWSDKGVCRAWRGFGSECIGVASGYGYDKESYALAQGISKIYGIEMHKGAAGVDSVIEEAMRYGIKVVSSMDLAWDNWNDNYKEFSEWEQK